jgi:hypothetical protein
MPTATVLIRPVPSYRHDAFRAGLERLGYALADRNSRPGPEDILVTWNRKPTERGATAAMEAAGGRVIIAENGYIGRSPDGKKLYALALRSHNGAGHWNIGGPERLAHQMATGWAPHGIELKPWRAAGEFLLLLPQRGIGEQGVAMPPNWIGHTQSLLRQRTKREIRIRRHPGDNKADPWPDFVGAHAALTWGSGAAIKALVAGIPVFHGLPRWIGAGAAKPITPRLDVEAPAMSDADRVAMLERLAWAQWSADEIASGEAFKWLLT